MLTKSCQWLCRPSYQVILLCHLPGSWKIPGFLLCSSDTRLTSVLLLTSDNHYNSSLVLSCAGKQHLLQWSSLKEEITKRIPTEVFHPWDKKTDAVWQDTQQEHRALCLQICNILWPRGLLSLCGWDNRKHGNYSQLTCWFCNIKSHSPTLHRLESRFLNNKAQGYNRLCQMCGAL